jgi:hypothetical protein
MSRQRIEPIARFWLKGRIETHRQNLRGNGENLGRNAEKQRWQILLGVIGKL